VQHSAGDAASAVRSVSTTRDAPLHRSCVMDSYAHTRRPHCAGLDQRESASSRSCDITLASLRLRYRDGR
jgi:hypothetical protein